MILKLLFKGNEKEIPITDSIKNLPKLREEVGKIENLKEDSMLLSFIDVENDVIEIKDEHDLEYLLEQPKGEIIVRVSGEQKETEKKPEENVKQPEEKNTEEKPEEENQEEPYQQILTEEFRNSINLTPEEIVETKPEENNLQAREEENHQIAENNNEDAIPNNDNEYTLDITAINKIEAPKFELIDNKYDFTKNKPERAEQDYIEEGEKMWKNINEEDKIIEKENLQQLMQSSQTLQALQQKVDLLTDIVNQGFCGIQKEINSITESSFIAKEEVSKCNVKQNVHHGITCDRCHVCPIRGKRFKCLICPDYDLCSECESKNLHSHPLMRFYEPVNAKFAEQITTIYRIKSNVGNLDEYSLKLLVLKNVAGKDYDEQFYKTFIEKKKDQSFDEFLSFVLKIFG